MTRQRKRVNKPCKPAFTFSQGKIHETDRRAMELRDNELRSGFVASRIPRNCIQRALVRSSCSKLSSSELSDKSIVDGFGAELIGAHVKYSKNLLIRTVNLLVGKDRTMVHTASLDFTMSLVAMANNMVLDSNES